MIPTVEVGPVRCSRLIQGTMAIDQLGRSSTYELLDAVYAAGCATFDTAHVYGGGKNERLFGSWLADRGLRESVTVIVKGCEPGADGEPRVNVSALESDVTESLDRLSLATADLYLVHVDDPTAALEPVVDRLAEYVAAGTMRAYGFSNWTTARFAAACDYADRIDAPRPVAASVHFSLAEWQDQPWPGNVSVAGRQAADERSWYQQRGVPILSWSTLAGGFFADRVRADTPEESLGYFEQVMVRAYGSAENRARLERCRTLGDQLGATPAQVALAWVLHQPLQILPIVGSLSGEEFTDNAAALSLSLSDEQLQWLADG